MAVGAGRNHPRGVGTIPAVPPRVPVICAAVPALLGLLVLVAQGASGPVLFSDEIAYLGIGVDLSTRAATVQLAELEFYSPGYGVVLAPLLSVLPTDPWAVAVGLNLVCLAVLGPLLFLLLREVLDLDRWRAALAATIAACTPSVLLQVPRAWPELLLTTLLAAWAVLLARFVAGRHPAYGLAAAVAAAAALTTHRRAIIVVAVTAAAVLHVHVRELRARRGGGADPAATLASVAWLAGTLALTGVHLVANGALDRAVKDRLYQGGDLVNASERAVELAGGDVWPRLVGHGWSTLQATFGLVLLGVTGLLVVRWRDARRPFAVALAVVTAGSVAVSAVAVADGPRVDHLLYERYVAPVAVLGVAVGLGLLLDRRRRLPPAALLALPAATAALVLVVPSGRLEGNVQKLTVPTIASLEHLHRLSSSRFLEEVSPVRIGAVVLVAATALLLAGRWRTAAAAGVAFATFATVAVAGSVLGIRPFLDVWEPYGADVAGAIRDDGHDGEPIGATAGAPDPLRAVVQHRLGYPEVVEVDGQHCPPVGHVIAERAFSPAWASEVAARSDLPGAVVLRVRC